MNPCDQCDRQRLQLLLNDALPDDIENDVAHHVASCPSCQSELEALAAAKGWWVEASQRLSKSSAEAGSVRNVGQDLSATGPANPSSEFATNDRSVRSNSIHHDLRVESNLPSELLDEAYASDFAVDFLEPSDDATVLGRLGEYEIAEVIGRGGMGIVLKGFQKELRRFVAVKVLAPHLATSGAARRRFAREAQATAAVVNPHVMAIHSVHANSKLPYLVMPFVECESLQQRLDHCGPLDLKDILRIGMQAASGLAAAHAQGLVHRDVKPANILLETNVDRVMLTDFGLARAVDDASLTRTGIIAGTPQYMSPEQANGDAVDHRSDLFSLGSVLYAMCTARPPFRAETTFGVLRRIRETDPRPIREINADIPEWLEQIVLGNLLSKNPEHRMSTATEVATLLERCLAHVQQPTMVKLPDFLEHVASRPERQVRRTKTNARLTSRWAMFAIAAVVTIAALALSPRIKSPTGETHSVADESKAVENERDSVKKANTLDPLFDWNQMQDELNGTDQVLKQIESNVRSDVGPSP